MARSQCLALRQPAGLTADIGDGNIITIMNEKSAGTPLNKIAGPYLDDIADVAAELSRRGWAEANAGNISVRPGAGPVLGALLVKRANIRMRDLARNPAAGLCLLRFGAGDRSYSVLPKGTKPSSELPAHVAVHDMLARFRPHDRVAVHTHPTAIVSLTHRFPNPKQLLRRLLSTHTEAPLLLQDRLTVIPFLPPGSLSLGRTTAGALEVFSAVIWPGHGIVAVGPTASSALDLIELTEKAAQIALNIGSGAGLSPAQQKSIRKSFGLK
jgi:rhamnulose-1-phosphate aldolase